MIGSVVRQRWLLSSHLARLRPKNSNQLLVLVTIKKGYLYAGHIFSAISTWKIMFLRTLGCKNKRVSLRVIQTQSVIFGIDHHLCKRANQSSYFHPSVSASDGFQGLPARLLIHRWTGWDWNLPLASTSHGAHEAQVAWWSCLQLSISPRLWPPCRWRVQVCCFCCQLLSDFITKWRLP